MFKNIFVTMALAAMLVTSLPSEAGFGSSKSSSSSSSRSAAPSRQAAPAAPQRQAMAPPRQVGGGGNVGMQRSAVTANVRNPAPMAPTYQPQNVYRQPVVGQTYRPAYQTQHNTVIHHYSPSAGGGGFGMGTIAMAAMGGYMLNGIMHDHSGAVYNGAGYTNGVPTQGGQYYAPRASDEQVQAPQQQYAQQPQPQYAQQPQVIIQQAPVQDQGMGFGTKLLIGILFGGAAFFVFRRVFS